MKAKWITTLMAALFSGAFAVGAVASAEGTEDSYGGAYGAYSYDSSHSDKTAYQLTWKTTKSRLDTNGDGVISQKEASDSQALSSQFQKLDSNGDGTLDQAEFARFEVKQGQSMQSGQSGHDQGQSMQSGQSGTDMQAESSKSDGWQ